jgi:hypothetical protein
MRGERKPFQAKSARVRALRTGSWASTGKLGRVTTKDAEFETVGFGAYGG